MEDFSSYRWRRILVPTDFSGCSDRALGLADWLAKQHGAEVTLLHVSELANGLMLDTTVHPAGYAEPVSVERYLTSHAVVRMNEQAKRVLGKLAATRVAFGPTAATIAEVARQERSDLVVMGTHGRTGFKHLLLGSVAERVVRVAPCPVTVVHEQSGGDEGSAVLTPEEELAADEAQG